MMDSLDGSSREVEVSMFGGEEVIGCRHDGGIIAGTGFVE